MLSGGGRGFVRGLSAVDNVISGSCLLTSDARSSPSPAMLNVALKSAKAVKRCKGEVKLVDLRTTCFNVNYFYVDVGRQKSVREHF
jgi:hypothetical protein